MTELAFGIEAPRDLLAKARREVGRLEQAENWHGTDDWEPIADAAINAALTLWHITDWIANSPDPACQSAIAQIKAKRGSAKTAALAVLQEHVLDDSNIALCDALANGAKHFTIRERSLDPNAALREAGRHDRILGKQHRHYPCRCNPVGLVQHRNAQATALFCKSHHQRNHKRPCARCLQGRTFVLGEILRRLPSLITSTLI